MTKYSDKITRVIGRASNAATPFEALNCLITDEMLDDIAQHTSQYILTFHRNFRHESDAIFTDKTGVVYWVVAYLRVCRVRRAEGQDEC